MTSPNLMIDKNTYTKEFYIISGVGSAIILAIAAIITFELWHIGVEQDIYTDNFSTSVLYTDTLSVAGGAAPWALLSINCLAAKIGVKKWRKYVKKAFN